MGLFSNILNKNKEIIIKSPCEGQVMEMSKVKDETFSQDMMGKGFAVVPTGSDFVAPIAGQITLIADTGHAFSIKNKTGVEILVHIGVETVRINANKKPEDPLVAFKPLVQVGSKLGAGDPVMNVDLDIIKKHKCDLSTPIVVLSQSANYSNFKFEYLITSGHVAKGQDILKIT